MYEPNLVYVTGGLACRFDLIHIGEQRTQVGVFELIHSQADSCHNASVRSCFK